jgi:hypothetical protein
MISYGIELDFDNKLNSCLNITGILNNMFRPQKALKKTTKKLYNTLAVAVLLHDSEDLTVKSAVHISSRDAVQQDNSRIHLDRLKNNCTNCK